MKNLDGRMILKQTSYFLSQNKIFLLIFFFLSIEFINKTALDLGFGGITISFIFKSIFILIATIILFKEKNKLLIFCFTSLIIYLLLEFILNFNNIDSIFFIYGLRYLYYIFFISVLLKFKEISLNGFLIFFDILILFNSILIVIGFLFEIQIFRTYTGLRFGFNGLLNMPSDTNYIYVLYALLGYFYFNKRSSSFKFLLIFNIIISILTGTKTVIIISSIVLILLSLRRPIKQIALTYLSLSLIIGLFYKNIFERLGPTKDLFVKIYQEQGLLSAFSSYRFNNLKNTIDIYVNDTSLIDILIYNLNFIDIRVEMEFFDLLFFWGLLGGTLYIYFFVAINRSIINSKEKLYILGVLLLVAFMSGKFLTNFSAIFITYTFLTTKSTQRDI